MIIRITFTQKLTRGPLSVSLSLIILSNLYVQYIDNIFILMKTLKEISAPHYTNELNIHNRITFTDVLADSK